MAMTKKTINTYSFVLTAEQFASVQTKLDELTRDGATDGYVSRDISTPPTVIVTRHWVDQDAAAAWQAWSADYVAQFGYTYSSMEIQDI